MVLVTDNERCFLGTVSADDIHKKYRDHKTIEELVSQSVPVIQRTASAKDAFDRINEEKLRYLPVVDEQGALVGLVTRSSMVNAMASAVWRDDDGRLN